MNINNTLLLILDAINRGLPLAIEAYSEIKALSGMTDDEITQVWISQGEANKAEIAKRRLEIARSEVQPISLVNTVSEEMSDE